MNKIFFTLFFIVITNFVTANESNINDFYTTFGIFSDKFKEYVPTVSLGKKSISSNGNGVDFGATLGFLERRREKANYVLMFPRIEYIHYGSKNFENVNGYIGIGASSAMYRVRQGTFGGIVGNLTAGIDFFREKNLNGFVQAKSFYPLLSLRAKEKKAFPLISIDVGLGF